MTQKQIPKNWQEVELKDIVECLDGKRVPITESERIGGDIPYYGANGRIGWINDFIFDEELLLVAEDGGSWGKGQKCSYIINGKSWVNNHAHVLRINEDQANIKFLMFWLNHSNLNKYISGTTRGKLNQKSLNSIRFFLPSLETQKKIVSILEKAESLKIRNKKVEELLDEYLKSVFAEMFGNPESLKNKFDRIPFLKSIEKEASKNSLKIQGKYFLEEGKYPIIDQGEEFISGYTNDKSKVYDEKLPVIIFGDHTRILKFVDFPFALGADGVKILVPKEEFNPFYFYHCLKSLDIKSAGYSRHYKFLKSKKIPLPPLPLQQKFASIVEKVEKIKDKQKRELENAEELFDLLMQKAFKGELV